MGKVLETKWNFFYCLIIWEIYTKLFGSFANTIVSLLLELVRRKVNIIPKQNSWLMEAANVRRKMHSENVVQCIAVQRGACVNANVISHRFTLCYIQFFVAPCIAVLRRVAPRSLSVNGRKCCFVYCSVTPRLVV